MYTYARTRSILRKADDPWLSINAPDPHARIPSTEFEIRQDSLDRLSTQEERAVVTQLMWLGPTLEGAASASDPSKVASGVYELCRSFNALYFDKEGHAIATCSDPELRIARLLLVEAVAVSIRESLALLGIDTLEEM